MTHQLKKLYDRYFQKSKSFLVPILNLKLHPDFCFYQSYLQWEGYHTLLDRKLILIYDNYGTPEWEEYLLEELYSNKMFDTMSFVDDNRKIVIVFDLHCVEKDYVNVIEGRYSLLSKQLKARIREYYGYNSPEWAYMESFLFPSKYMEIYSKLLDVDEEIIKKTEQLCDKPDLNKETLKVKKDGKINDDSIIKMERKGHTEADTDKHRLSL